MFDQQHSATKDEQTKPWQTHQVETYINLITAIMTHIMSAKHLKQDLKRIWHAAKT